MEFIRATSKYGAHGTQQAFMLKQTKTFLADLWGGKQSAEVRGQFPFCARARAEHAEGIALYRGEAV